ncbi:MAG: DUF2500 family protein [Archangium sp.]
MPNFDLAAKSPQYPELMEFEPSISGHLFWGTVGIVFGLVLTAGCVYGALVLDDVPRLIAGVGALILAGVTFSSIRSQIAFKAAPLERLLACVKDETVEVRVTNHTSTDSRGRSRTRTRVHHDYYLLLEFEDGERESYEVDEETSRMVATGDIGVAYLKGDELLEFRPITGL